MNGPAQEPNRMTGNDQDPLDSPDDLESEKQYEEEPETSPDDAGVNGDD